MYIVIQKFQTVKLTFIEEFMNRTVYIYQHSVQSKIMHNQSTIKPLINPLFH